MIFKRVKSCYLPQHWQSQLQLHVGSDVQSTQHLLFDFVIMCSLLNFIIAY